jgi:hypothetical protein
LLERLAELGEMLRFTGCYKDITKDIDDEMLRVRCGERAQRFPYLLSHHLPGRSYQEAL